MDGVVVLIAAVPVVAAFCSTFVGLLPLRLPEDETTGIDLVIGDNEF